MITASTSTTVVTVMVWEAATAADDALLSANAGCTDRHSGWRRGPGSVVRPELAGAAAAPRGAGMDACWATSGVATATQSTAAILSQRCTRPPEELESSLVPMIGSTSANVSSEDFRQVPPNWVKDASQPNGV